MPAKPKRKRSPLKKSAKSIKISKILLTPIKWIALTDLTEVQNFLTNLNSNEIQIKIFDENYAFFRALEKNIWDIILIDSGIWSYLPKDSRKRLVEFLKNRKDNPVQKAIYLETEPELDEIKCKKNLIYVDDKNINESSLGSPQREHILFDTILFWKLGEDSILLILEKLKTEIKSLAFENIFQHIRKIENPFPLLAGQSEEKQTLEKQFDAARHSFKELLIAGGKGSLGDELGYLAHQWHQEYGRYLLEFDIQKFPSPPISPRDLKYSDIKTLLIKGLESISPEKLSSWKNLIKDSNLDKTKIIWVIESSSPQQIIRFRKSISPAEFIQIPPLADRTFDIPSIIQVYLKQLLKEQEMEISKSVLTNLLNQKWPAGYAQLKQHIHTWLLPLRKKITLPDLPSFMISQDKGWHEAIRTLPFPEQGISIERIEKELLERALKITNYSISKSARLLSIGRKAFIYRMKKYKIQNKKQSIQK